MSMKLLILPAVLTGLMLAAAVPARAQDPFGRDRVTFGAQDGSGPEYAPSTYAPETSYQPNVRAIIHQRAQEYGAQRRARLAALRWYGMSNARPTASPTPFSSMYSPVWQMPGGRPFAWFPTTRSNFLFYTR